MRSARDFFKPLAVGAPEPLREIPFRPSRVIHFFPPHIEKVVAKLPEIVPTVDILLGNLEDAIPMADKEAARAGLVEVGRDRSTWATPSCGPASTASTRRGARRHHSPSSTEVGDKLDVIMIPKVEGPEDIHYVDRLLAQLEAKAGLDRPILVHAILETARGVANVEEICARVAAHAGPVARTGRPRRQPADEDHPRRRRPPRLPRARRPGPGRPDAPRADLSSRTCGTTRSRGWSTPA